MKDFINKLTMNQKIAIVIGSILILLVAMSTFSTDSPTESSSSYTPPAQTYTEPDPVDEYNSRSTLSAEAAFLSDVHSLYNPILESGTDSQLLEMGYGACDSLDSGQTLSSLAIKFGNMYSGDPEGREAAYGIIAGAVLNLCPEYAYQADSL